MQLIRELAAQGSREATTQAYTQAADLVQIRLAARGYSVRRQTFTVPAGTSWGVPVPRGRTSSIVAVRAGLAPGDPHLVVGAHLNPVPQSPGAEDNASRIAVLMELARLAHPGGTRLPVTERVAALAGCPGLRQGALEVADCQVARRQSPGHRPQRGGLVTTRSNRFPTRRASMRSPVTDTVVATASGGRTSVAGTSARTSRPAATSPSDPVRSAAAGAPVTVPARSAASWALVSASPCVVTSTVAERAARTVMAHSVPHDRPFAP